MDREQETSDVYKVSRAMRRIAEMIDSEIEKEVGRRVAFSLVIYTAPRASYVSSCERSEAIRELKRLIELWESGMSDIPAHKVN